MAREGKLDLFVHLMGNFAVREWLFVLHPNRKKPMRGLLLQARNPKALEGVGDLHVWLAEHAPHVGRIG